MSKMSKYGSLYNFRPRSRSPGAHVGNGTARYRKMYVLKKGGTQHARRDGHDFAQAALSHAQPSYVADVPAAACLFVFRSMPEHSTEIDHARLRITPTCFLGLLLLPLLLHGAYGSAAAAGGAGCCSCSADASTSPPPGDSNSPAATSLPALGIKPGNDETCLASLVST